MSFDLTDDDVYDMMLHGAMSPIFEDEDQYRKFVEGLDVDVTNGFVDTYLNINHQRVRLVEQAKIFVLDNWERIDDWSELEITLESAASGLKTSFFTFKGEDDYLEATQINSKHLRNARERRIAQDKSRNNPIESFDDVVLDFHDGDFSVTVNGQDYLFLSPREILTLAFFIESKLKEE